jgi:hypothetical protein
MDLLYYCCHQNVGHCYQFKAKNSNEFQNTSNIFEKLTIFLDSVPFFKMIEIV